MTIGLIANNDGSGAVQLGGTNAISIDTSLNSTMAGYVSAPNTFGFKNRLINGAMVIDQRNAGASVTPTTDTQYTLDRWSSRLSVTSKFSVQQNAGSVTPPTGYTKYLGVTSLSAYNVQTTDYFCVEQYIEGLNSYDLAWGTSSAVTVSLSFWVRSSLTGTFGGTLRSYQNPASASYPFTYTISAANTWEQKTVTIAGPTIGTFVATNSGNISVSFGLGAGATYSGTAGTWAAASYFSATGATSVVGTNGATFYVTGVQLEKGSVATPFDFRDYGRELALCQRYYQRWGDAVNAWQVQSYASGGAQNPTSLFTFPVSMRTAPTATLVGSPTYNNASLITSFTSTAYGGFLYLTSSAAGQSYAFCSGSGNYFKFEAEL